MRISIILIKLFVYGLVIPLLVLFMADIAIRISCIYYWGEENLSGHAGFKLSMWLWSLALLLTSIYYLFCFLYKTVKRKSTQKTLLKLFIFVPILFYGIDSRYDIRITISFALFHISFYALLFATKYVSNRFFSRNKSIKVE